MFPLVAIFAGISIAATAACWLFDSMTEKEKKRHDELDSELSELIESMKTEGKGSPVSNLRNEIKLSVRRERCDSADKLPVIVFSSTFCRQKGRYQFSKYNGLVLVEVNGLINSEEAIISAEATIGSACYCRYSRIQCRSNNRLSLLLPVQQNTWPNQ